MAYYIIKKHAHISVLLFPLWLERSMAAHPVSDQTFCLFVQDNSFIKRAGLTGNREKPFGSLPVLCFWISGFEKIRKKSLSSHVVFVFLRSEQELVQHTKSNKRWIFFRVAGGAAGGQFVCVFLCWTEVCSLPLSHRAQGRLGHAGFICSRRTRCP